MPFIANTFGSEAYISRLKMYVVKECAVERPQVHLCCRSISGSATDKLKELGAKNIILYVTHCESTILEGEVLTCGLIDKVYTTNSLFAGEHEKIKVISL